MKIVVTYSTKDGLLQEYQRRTGIAAPDKDIPVDFFAEGDGPETISAIINVFEHAGHTVIGLEADDRLLAKLQDIRPDIVFNIAEGLWGDFRESYVPMICERLGLPYTGSDPLTLAVCLNKARTKEVLGYYLVPTAPFCVFQPGETVVLDAIDTEVIIKPVSEGSSKGIFDDAIASSVGEARTKIEKALLQYQQPVLLEQFLSGPEFTVAMWGNGAEAEALPIISMDYSQLPEGAKQIYSYEAKWIWDTRERPLEIFHCPADISEGLQNQIKTLAMDTFRILQIRDWCRIDIRLDDSGQPHVLEINPLPGILPDPRDNSCFPKAARTAGYSYPEMLLKVLDIAARRNGLSS